ncbi:MAG: hypothetical protein VX737_02325 [Pseudomonadota bacterium]|nr:hypothetical protein [Pseudomonadota bacterium]
MPDNQVSEDESFVDYLIASLEDRTANQGEFDLYDFENLYTMYMQWQNGISVYMGDIRDVMLQGYVSASFPEGSNFLYEINRSLMTASQTSLASYDLKPTFSSGSSDTVQVIKYNPATALGSIDDLLASSPNNQVSLDAKNKVLQYNLRSRVKGTDYESISDFLNKIDFSVFSVNGCARDYLANQCIPCQPQVDTSHYDSVMYQDITNSSCTMRKIYLDEPWNGMKSVIAALKDLDATLASEKFRAKLPDSYLNSNSFTAYKNGISCLIGDIVSIYNKNGNWFDFFHWSNFTKNTSCTDLLSASGRSVESVSDDGFSTMMYNYVFDSSNTATSTQNVTLDSINVVNIIDGYLQTATSSNRLQTDPTKGLMLALQNLLFRMRISIQGQVSRSVVDVTSGLLSSSSDSSTILPDQAYLLDFFMQAYNSSSYEWSGASIVDGQQMSALSSGFSECRYQGLGQTLSSSSSSSQALDHFDLQQSVLRDVVGQGAISSPLVGFQIPLPALVDVTVDSTSISPKKQAAFLKYGKFNLSARYVDQDTGAYKYGVLQASDSKQDFAKFSLARLVDLVRENQDEVKEIIDDKLLSYNRNMNSLIAQRMMISYVYEYLSVSSMSSWGGMTQSGNQMCLLSPVAQIQVSSTWRKDPVNDELASLISNADDSGTSSGASSNFIQYNDSMTTWDSIETLRDEAFQLAKSNYLQYLEYKIKELLLVFKATILVQDLANSSLIQSSFPATYDSTDKNAKSYVLVNSQSSSSGTGTVADDDGNVDPDAVQDASGQPSSTVDDMVNDAADSGCCPSVDT